MNRKQRRAQESSQPIIRTADDIPLAQPDKALSTKKSKTLFEIAAEKQAQLNPSAAKFNSKFNPENVVEVKIGEDGKVVPNTTLASLGPGAEDRSETPWLDAILLGTTLAAVHFTFEVLTVHQYAQELRFPPIFAHTILVAWPTLLVIVSLFRGLLFPISSDQLSENVQLWISGLRQLVQVTIANVAGCYLVHLTNDKGYYAVMKNAPAVGTIWVWAILELGIFGALAGVTGPGLYAWWYGYGIF